MSNTRRTFEDDDFALSELERAIYAARNYVVPSDDLRPQTLEAAREHGRDRTRVRWSRIAAVFGLFFWCFGGMLASSASGIREGFVAPFGDEVHSIATEISLQENDSFEWGLVEVFSRYRSLSGMHRFTSPENFR
ncbi:MAG: hypothetical protein SGI77_09950 [Pirellulaceae bacterium]|nr:hypothetical protein [Pirellulaceae bacterium]